MAGNTFGTIFTVTTFGESHGAAIGVVVDGCPAGIPLELEDFTAAFNTARPLGGGFWSRWPGLPMAALKQQYSPLSIYLTLQRFDF